MDKNERLKVHR